MHIRDLSGKSICILGYGREGQAMARALEKYAPRCRIVIADRDKELRIMNYELRRGEKYLENLNRFDVIIKSPGIPPKDLLTTNYKLLTSPTQIFLDSITGSGATVIGITGSKGKSTTASLLFEILNSQFSILNSQVFLVGNIGEPAISHLEDAKTNTIFVQEMSSYQLMDLRVSPQIAVITAFFPEHLDYHSIRPVERGSLMASHGRYTPLENYLEAKKHITRFQTKNDIVFFQADSKEAAEIAGESAGRKIPFSKTDAPVKLDEILLKGEHNLSNIAAAYKVAMHLGSDSEQAIQTIKQFKGLPHRLESLGVHQGIEWVNDSISTTPESAIAAIDALGERIETIIVGGQDRGYDFSSLTKRIKNSKIKNVILLPESGMTIGKEILKIGGEVKLFEVKNMEEAVRVAKQQRSEIRGQNARSFGNNSLPLETFAEAKWGQFPIVLLSPAAPSYGHFKDFTDRGNKFKMICSLG